MARAEKTQAKSKGMEAKGKSVKVAAAKGRPMLTWVGKRPLNSVSVFPAQHVETFDPTGELDKPKADEHWTNWPEAYPRGGLLFHGDNKEVLGHLLANGFRGKVEFIYIDPPFDSGADYVRRVSLRGDKGAARIEGEGYTLGEQIQYTDIWANDEYLQFMYERLLIMKELLSSKGVVALHLDWRRTHLLRALLDEVFGSEHFVNEVIWHYFGFKRKTSSNFPRKHDSILIYAKGEKYEWETQFLPHSDAYLKRWKKDKAGRYYRDDVNPTGGGSRVIYLDEVGGDIVDSVWEDIPPVNPVADERQDFPTQKPVKLVDRLISAFTRPGALVLDSFVGSGTTAEAAQRAGRRWVACDINKGAIQTTSKRLQEVILEMKTANAQESLTQESTSPIQLAFTTWRVNDYDLQIQHNEAVELACQHVGVQRTRTDSFFDGTLGKDLVKIVPFTHPLSPVDLEAIKAELGARPDEDRSVIAICLGIELAAKTWLQEWNRLKRGRNAVNRIEYIELRTDPKFGGFIKHEPASARVAISRANDLIVVDIKDFVSPAIVERLRRQTGVTKPKSDGWRAMVDSVMIDTAYNGKVFNIALSDVPRRKKDLVAGRYELPAADGATVAVKITDMLGEEVLVTSEG